MKARYSKRVRDEAALICAIAASNPDLHETYNAVCYETDRDPYGQACQLAFDAWNDVQNADHPDAEAEALIRTGWSP